MKVKLRYNWFAPSSLQIDSGRSLSGRRYKKGVHEIPDEYKDILPSSAEILTGPVVSEPEPELTLADYDMVRAGSEHLERVEKAARRASKKA